MADDEAPEMELDEIDVGEMQIETLAGDLRDAMLMRFRDTKRPWTALTEEEQRDLANGMELAAKEMVRGAVRLLSGWEWPRAVVKLADVKIIGGDNARLDGKITAANIEENRNILGDHVGTFMMLVAVNSDAFMGERAEAQIDPDQPELPEQGEAGDGDADQADAFAALADKATTFVRSEGNATTGALQRYLGTGYNKAAGVMEELERREVVSSPDAKGKRTILRGGDGEKPSGEAA